MKPNIKHRIDNCLPIYRKQFNITRGHYGRFYLKTKFYSWQYFVDYARKNWEVEKLIIVKVPFNKKQFFVHFDFDNLENILKSSYEILFMKDFEKEEQEKNVISGI